jgi:CRP-like cAMP-binding protein
MVAPESLAASAAGGAHESHRASIAVRKGTGGDGDGVPRNRLLAALPPAELARVRPHLEALRLESGQVLFEAETPIVHVYFPETAVVSVVSALRQGGAVEVGTAGCEGMAGLPAFLGDDAPSTRVFAQVPGAAVRMEAGAFARLAGAPGPLHRLMLRYTQAFLIQVAQTAACNAAHLVEQRCARWLLMTHDRVGGDTFPLSHEFLATMLGVRRPGVTVAMRALQDAGLVDYVRGHVTVRDLPGLEAASCECYGVVRAHYDRLLPARS